MNPQESKYSSSFEQIAERPFLYLLPVGIFMAIGWAFVCGNSAREGRGWIADWAGTGAFGVIIGTIEGLAIGFGLYAWLAAFLVFCKSKSILIVFLATSFAVLIASQAIAGGWAAVLQDFTPTIGKVSIPLIVVVVYITAHFLKKR